LAQPTVFSQIIKLVPRSEFQASVFRHRGDHGVRHLDCWTWFGALLFGQLTGHDSIRAIERVFAHSDPKMKDLGFGPVRKSTLADANQTRPLEILEDVFGHLLKRAKTHAPSHGFPFNGRVLALDASVISLSLKLMPWARFSSTESSVKLHTALDLAGDLPDLVVIGPGTLQDMKMARSRFRFQSGTTVIFDKGYSNFAWYQKLTDQGVFFVTRQKDYTKTKVIRSRKTNRTRGYICDQDVYIAGRQAQRQKLVSKLRRISYRDPATGKKLIFLTNRFDLTTETICDLYKARWRVELFFKTLKQNLKIKKFLGTTAHAVQAQIWVALIAYLLIQVLRLGLKARLSVPDTMAVLGVLLLLREPLSRLLGTLPLVTRHPRDLQLILNL
jgi:putative transposase